MPLGMGDAAQAEIQSLRAQLAAAQAVAAEVARIKAINADLEARNALLELQNEKMRRTLFGQRSERTRHLLDQMELTFEECETAASEDELLAALAAAKTNVAPFERKRPARKALPEHLPRERVVIAAPDACPAAARNGCASWVRISPRRLRSCRDSGRWFRPCGRSSPAGIVRRSPNRRHRSM